MSKKFLTIFALVALLVAAMAGSAFAAVGDVSILRDVSSDNTMGAISEFNTVDGYSTKVYYIGDATEAQTYFAVSVDKPTGVLSLDIYLSDDVKTPLDTKVDFPAAGKWVSLDVTLDIMPDDSYIGYILVTSADDATAGRKSVSFDITFEQVALFEDEELIVDEEFTEETVKILGFNKSYDFDGAPNLMSGDTAISGATVVYTDPDTDAEIVVSFDNTTGEITVVQSGDVVSDDVEIKLVLSADQFVVSEDTAKPAVAGFDGKTAATLVIKAGVGSDPDPVEGDLIFKPESNTLTFTSGTMGVEEVIVVSQDKFAGVAIESITIEDADDMYGLTVEQRTGDEADEFAIYGDVAAVEEETELTFKVKATLVDGEILSGDYTVTILPAGGSSVPAEFGTAITSDTATMTALTAKDIVPIDVAVWNAEVAAGNIKGVGTSTAVENIVGQGLKIEFELPFDGGNAVPVTYENTTFFWEAVSPLDGTYTQEEYEDAILAILNKSFDIYYEYVPTADFKGDAAKPVRLIGRSGAIVSWEDAHKAGIVDLDTLNINYVIVDRAYDDDDTKPFVAGKAIVVYDGDPDGWIRDPLFVSEKEPSKDSGSSGVGCDAGFGAFALLGLAGMAALLRKKD